MAITSFWLSWVQPIMPIELRGPHIHQLKQLGIPYYRMGTAITSSAKFLPCILNKIKCEYFLQSIPNHPPRASKWGHRRHSQLLKHGQQLFLPKMHLYTLWYGCTTSTSREDVLKLGCLPFGPCSWAPMGDQMHVLNKWHFPFYMNNHILLKYLNMCFLGKRKYKHFHMWPLINLDPPPPFLGGLVG